MKTTVSFLLAILFAAGLTSSRAETHGVKASFTVITEDSTCAVPTNLQTTNITATSADLKWSKVDSAVGYKIRIKPAGSNQWTYHKISSGGKRHVGHLDSNTTYIWQIKTVCSMNPGVTSAWSAKQTFTTGTVKVAAPATASSFDVNPNPLNLSSVVSFSLTNDSRVQIQLMDVTGRKLQTVMDANLSSGNHQVTLNRDAMGAGIYFLQLKMIDPNGVGQVITKKLVVE